MEIEDQAMMSDHGDHERRSNDGSGISASNDHATAGDNHHHDDATAASNDADHDVNNKVGRE